MESSSFTEIFARAHHPDFIDEPGAYTCSPLPSCFGLNLFPVEDSEHHSSTLESLLGAFESNAPPSSTSIFVVLRGIALNLNSCERIARCIAPATSSPGTSAFDVCILDLAPQLYEPFHKATLCVCRSCCPDIRSCRRFDRNLRRYVHFKENKADPNIGNDGLAVLLSALKNGPHRGMLLSDLIIPRCNIGKAGATLLAKHLQHDFKNLQLLDIRENPGLGANFGLIAQSMQYCSLLTTLNLSACGLGAHGPPPTLKNQM
jgi:hypothetical protein